MDNELLTRYVADRIRAGASQSVIREELGAIGWTEDETADAFRSGVIAYGAPLPTLLNRSPASKKASTVDGIINFFSFLLLGIVATALGTLYFQIVNIAFPDSLDQLNWYTQSAQTSAIHYSIAALLIGFPLYVLSVRLWFRAFGQAESRVESKLSRLLTYLVLLIAALTIVGDLITTVFALLQGEITIRFFLKALTILGIAGAIFGFYYFERRKVQYLATLSPTIFRFFGRGVTAIVLLGIALGFLMGGSPTTNRERALDEERSEQLLNVASCIDQYAQTLGALPDSLEALLSMNQSRFCETAIFDPETGEQYEYRVIVPMKTQGAVVIGEYELCAVFALPTKSVTESAVSSRPQLTRWQEHDAGRSCDVVETRLMVPPSDPVKESPVLSAPIL